MFAVRPEYKLKQNKDMISLQRPYTMYIKHIQHNNSVSLLNQTRSSMKNISRAAEQEECAVIKFNLFGK